MFDLVKTVKSKFKELPVIGPIALKMKSEIFGSTFRSGEYWEKRYKSGGNSGAGSYNRLARFKAEIINGFVADNNIKTVVEYGCGDGSQLSLASYPAYVGVDVSETIVQRCRDLFKDDASKAFCTTVEASRTHQKADLALSLDVVYHLVEDSVFETYMNTLFDSPERFVIVYASDVDKEAAAQHVRHRNFTAWIVENRPDWILESRIDNIYPYNPADPENTSFADFFIFKRVS